MAASNEAGKTGRDQIIEGLGGQALEVPPNFSECVELMLNLSKFVLRTSTAFHGE